MNTKGVKLLLFSVIVMLFSLMLVFAGFVIVLLSVAPAVIRISGLVGDYPGGEANIVVVAAIVAGIGGLFAAWFGLNRND